MDQARKAAAPVPHIQILNHSTHVNHSLNFIMQGTCYTISEGLSFVSVRGDAEQEREVTATGGGVTTADIRTIVHATLSPVDLQHLVSDVKVYTASSARVAVPPWRCCAPAITGARRCRAGPVGGATDHRAGHVLRYTKAV